MSEKICQHIRRRPIYYREKAKNGKLIRIENTEFCQECSSVIQIIMTAFNRHYTQKIPEPVLIGFKTLEV